MIKLKSLFRRGQSGPSGSSKHLAARSKSQSTTSLNSTSENEQQANIKPHVIPSANTYYPSISERAVDVGDHMLSVIGDTYIETSVQKQQYNSNTLPKHSVGAKKSQKLPKRLPTIDAQKPTQNADFRDVMPTRTVTPNIEYSPKIIINKASSLSCKENTNSNLNEDAVGSNSLKINYKMQELQTQLENIGREKNALESRIAELLPYQSEVTLLRTEILKMQGLHEKNQLEITNLKYENESLRSRLHDVVNSPLSDAEKHQIIQDSQRLHSSAPASIALPSVLDVNDICANNASACIGGTTPCLTPDWDKNSSSSEISVACLQDKIIQMEETHYSTNEELQATLQELADLQSQLSDAQTENERLSEEKDVLFQSLCRQTEKLNETRTQITTLQDLLLRDTKEAEVTNSEREQKLLDLIKKSKEERESALKKQEELMTELLDLRKTIENSTLENSCLRERIIFLESMLDSANSDRKQIEQKFQHAKEEISQRSIETARLTTVLENARSKIDELELELARGEKSDISDLLDAARKEKDLLEERTAELQEQFSHNKAELDRLKEQIDVITEEKTVAKNNAKCAMSHLEYRIQQLKQEKEKLSGDYQRLIDSNSELQMQNKCYLEDKTKLQNLLSDTQKHLGDVECKLNETKEQLENEIKLRLEEVEEWQQFQSDLLMTVRVANDFKTEALSEREQLLLDNKTQKEKIRLLEQQIEKLNKHQVKQNETQQSVLSTVQQEMASRRNKTGSNTNFKRQDSRLSVKTLIETIENNKAQTSKAEETELSRYSSTSSLNSINMDSISSPGLENNINLTYSKNNTNEWTENVRAPVKGSLLVNSSNLGLLPSGNSAFINKGTLREQQSLQQIPASNLHITNLTTSNISKSPLSGERKDPLNMLAKNGGSKRNALLKWCQNKTVGYRNIDITNFSSSWNDGLALCAILHSYLPDSIPYDTLNPTNKRRNFALAFAAAESVGISTTLNINDMCQIERPDWMQVMSYVTSIYKHFET